MGGIGFLMILVINHIVLDIQGRLNVMAEELRKLGAAQGVRLF